MRGIVPSADLFTGGPITSLDGIEFVGDEELGFELQQALTKYLGTTRNVTRLGRRLAAYRSSFPLEELNVTFQNGTELQLMFKSLGRRFNSAERIKPSFLHDPQREIDAYESVLCGKRLGTPACYGSTVRKSRDHYWLFIERVDGTRLRELGDFSLWLGATEWLAELHTMHATEVEALRTRPHLLSCDRKYFARWMSRAIEISGRDDESRAQLEWLAAHFEKVLDRLTALPLTFIHGEFYPSNVLIRQRPRDTAICAVDWEMAAIGPGLLDLAAFVSGWAEEFVLRFARAYYDVAGPSITGESTFQSFLDALDHCRALLAIQWLGWCAGWAPPPEHRLNWLREATRLTRRLGV